MKSALIVDDHPMIHIGCNQMLKMAGIVQIWEAYNLDAAHDATKTNQPDLIVLDLSLPRGNGLDAMDSLRGAAPDTKILVFTMNDRPVFARRALDAGANGFLSKNAPPSCFRDAISTLTKGQVYLDHALALEVIALQAQRASWTPREIEMFEGLAQGEGLAQIAKRLGVSYKTVANLSSALKKKTGKDSLGALARFAMQDDWQSTS